MSVVSFRIKQDKAELREPKVTVTSVAVTTTKFLFSIYDCMVNTAFGTGDFSLVRSHVSPCMVCMNSYFECKHKQSTRILK